MENSLKRRLITVSGVCVLAVVLLVALPAWVPLLFLADAVRGRWRFPLVRFGFFGLMWAWLEVAGVKASVALWVVGKSSSLPAHYAVQRWWTASIVRALRISVGMRVTVDGVPDVGRGPFIALCRHASLADSILSAWIFATHLGLNPRYVLKKELKLDPCLDVVGHRLPNYFVDRSSANVASELQGISQMAADLQVNDVAVIFPEGSRAAPQKRERALESLVERSPHRAARLEKLQHLIVPRPAGASALLQAVPHANVLFMWHSGFEGMDTFKGILRQLGTCRVNVHVRISEVARNTIPTGDEFVAWLDDQWLKMDSAIGDMIANNNLGLGVSRG